ncbi:hypothetical protein [Spiroplasma poulsonii]|uniref:Uncharacterized protein n=1 Tax=Spiroplasma poulsonii TaxID=2138 RepID=A0A2P6FCZ8_9MOLU|nr:hypothetical protein [Spiroplasma poulsonii]KAF0850961.1 PTS system, N-acetylglucosamine-specific IIC component [Spiroplasma poulsonii]PQM31331.1 hypothetical protein SMSRO_SF011480 [Spiroplasma poulsonii]PWF96334.1 hypothetical protein SMSE_17810 [Spiroplasma poulsonii]PWF99110.1 hypothetical protein SMH99_16820 [Spiroplasma poulsonii]
MNLSTPGREDEAAMIAKSLGKSVEKHAKKKALQEQQTANGTVATTSGNVNVLLQTNGGVLQINGYYLIYLKTRNFFLL